MKYDAPKVHPDSPLQWPQVQFLIAAGVPLEYKVRPEQMYWYRVSPGRNIWADNPQYYFRCTPQP